MIRFIHTADLQLGMPFNWVSGDAGSQLRQYRLDVIDRILALAEERQAQFILIGGDLFDANSVEGRVIAQACEKFAQTQLPIFVIPGNHDHDGGPDCVFRRSLFVSHKAVNMHVLLNPEPFYLREHNTLILPAPLKRRHAVGDTTTHITSGFGRELSEDAYRIGLAHGGLPWFGGDADGEATNAISQDRAQQGDLDYLALGDWHSTKQIDDKTWYSGAPEPTTFRQPDSGNVLFVEIPEPGHAPQVEAIAVGRTRWVQHEAVLSGEADLAALQAWLDSLDAPLDTLLRLSLSGSLSYAGLAELETLLTGYRAKLLHLRDRGDGVIPTPTSEEIDAIASDGYLRQTVERLRSAAAASDESDTVAEDALLLMYRLRVQREAGA